MALLAAFDDEDVVGGHAIIDRLRFLADDPAVVERLVAITNAYGRRRLIALERELRGQQGSLAQVRAEAATLLGRTSVPDFDAGHAFLSGELQLLTVRLNELEGTGLAIEREMTSLKSAATPDSVRAGLANFSCVFAHLKRSSSRS